MRDGPCGNRQGEGGREEGREGGRERGREGEGPALVN